MVGAFPFFPDLFNWHSFETTELKDPRRTAEVDRVSLSHLSFQQYDRV